MEKSKIYNSNSSSLSASSLTDETQSNEMKGYRIYLSWLILALFFLYQYILRSSPGVLIEEIRYSFNMNADQFAIIGSMYYYGYSIMQIPLGFLVDRFGIRSIALLSITLCILGTLLFITTTYPIIAYLSRLLVGIGAASAFMGAVKIANDYFPLKLKGIAIGSILSFGAVGALITGAPLNYVLNYFAKWQNALAAFALSGILLLLLAYIYLPKTKHSEQKENSTKNNIIQTSIILLKNKKIILYSVVAIGLFAPLSVMADLWGTAFLVKKFSLTRETASTILMNIYIGMAIGSVVLPMFINKFTINSIIKISSLSLLILFSLLVYINNLNYTQLIILLLLIGFFCGAEMLCFTGALRFVEPKISGLTIGVVNTLNMLSGAVMQQIIGYYLDYVWKNDVNQHGLRNYSMDDFIGAFSVLVVIIALCTILAFIALNNKNYEQKNIG